MKQSEKELKKAIIKSTQSIKKKYRDLHKERFINEEHFREQFKPIIDPLDSFIQDKEKLLNIDSNSKNGNSEEIQEAQTLEHKIFDESTTSNLLDSSCSRVDKQIDYTAPCSTDETSISLNSLDDCLNILKSKHHDQRFGIRKLHNQFKIGHYVVSLNEDKISLRNKHFNLTNGLRNLLFLKKPINYTTSDLNVYKQILLLTDVHKLNLDKKSDHQNVKYNELIKPLFKMGNGIQTEYKQVSKESKNSDYTYWDDPNELIDRLRLLISSSSAGHNAHNNEIISIVEELREADIID